MKHLHLKSLSQILLICCVSSDAKHFDRGRLDQCSGSDGSNQMQSCILNVLIDNSDQCQPPELASDVTSSPPGEVLLWIWFTKLISVITAHWSIGRLWLLVWYCVLYFSTNALLILMENEVHMEKWVKQGCLTLLLLSRTVDKHKCWHFSWYGLNPLDTHPHMHAWLSSVWYWLPPSGVLLYAPELPAPLNLN